METFYWSTEYEHANNSQTMSEYIELYLPGEWDVEFIDDAFAIISNRKTILEVHASGNGDSFNHKVEFKEREEV